LNPYEAPSWLLAPPESRLVPWRLESPRLSRPTSQLCTISQFDEPEYTQWCAAIGEPPRPHRKQWEFCWILAAMREADLLRPKSRLLGFGVGREPIPAMLAANGVDVVATDAPTEIADAQGWRRIDEHSESLMHLHRSELVDEATFRERVAFRTVNMNSIPTDLRGFDGCWSSCCFEHLGGLEHGLRFVENSLHTLRPGGYAIHTTEFNLSSNEDTLESEGLSFYRRRDIESLIVRLVESGHCVWPLNLHPGSAPLDRFVDTPPYTLPHVKLEALGFITTSIGLVVKKAGQPR
jgi:hypothetical protein